MNYLDAPPAQASASDAVARSLRGAILHGELQGGERVLQDDLARRFGVSQMVVREAFGRLVHEGFLHQEPRRGVSVARLDADDALELAQLRSLVEVQALGLALPRLADQDLERAKRILDELESTADAAEIIALNAGFHDTLYQPAGRARTLALIATLRLGFDRYFRFACDETGHVPRSNNEHRELLALCAAKDRRAACSLLRRHILDTGDAVAARIEALRNPAR